MDLLKELAEFKKSLPPANARLNKTLGQELILKNIPFY